jgi:membrane-bound metal-dependent hydrolase YbcI (DUF457 family)
LEPFTHAFTALAVSQTLQRRLPRFGTATIVASAVAPDLDYASYFAGAGSFLELHRSALHSVAGGTVLCIGIAAAAVYASRKSPPKTNSRRATSPLTLKSAFALCVLGFVSHVILDLASGEGVQLLWPFRNYWSHWSLTENFDIWLFFLLIAGLLIPQLFRLVGEEVGASKKQPGGGAAVFTLVLIVAYLGGRAYLHGRATDLLLSAEYHQREPLSAGAFPSAMNPFVWGGLVATDNTIEEIEVNLGPGTDFNPDRSATHYKPGESPQLNVAEGSPMAQRFLRYAAFPLAVVARREDGYRIDLRDLRFPAGDTSAANVVARIEMTSSLQITQEELRFATSGNDSSGNN